MPDDADVIDVPVPLPGSGDSGDGTQSGDDDMPAAAGMIEATIEKSMDQAYTKSQQIWLAQQDRENAGNGFLAESTRLTFSAAAGHQVELAGGILAQRSAGAQPQSGYGPGKTIMIGPDGKAVAL